MPYLTTKKGLRLHYRESGTGPRAALLLHGNLGTSRDWERVAGLLPASLRVIAPDRRGAGASDRPTGPWTMADLAADLRELTDLLGLGRVSLVGHSFGGGEALQFAADWPERVERLVLINSPSPEGLQVSPERFAQYEAAVRNPAVMKHALGLMMPTAPRDRFLQELMDESVATALGSFLTNARALHDMNVAERIGRLSASTLILYGRQDPLVLPAMVQRTQELIPGAISEVWDEIGHSAPVEAPERLTRRLTEFLEV